MTTDAAGPTAEHAEALEALLRSTETGTPFRDAWERYLTSIPADLAYRMEWGSRESVGAIALLTRIPVKGPALVLGSGFLGTAPALGILGNDVVVFDTSSARARFAAARGRAAGMRIAGVSGAGLPLPFSDGAFALVVMPDAPHGLPSREMEPLDDWVCEAFRVLTPGGQLVLLGQNRLAYKNYTGFHGRFSKPGPVAYLRRAVNPANPERTHGGYARCFTRAGFESVKGYATYVSHLDYHYVSALHPGDHPVLEIGRKERRNLVKWVGYRLGLFRYFVPSLATLGVKPGGTGGPTLLDALARGAAELAGLDGSRARADHLLATRGNAALALVSLDAAPATPSPLTASHVTTPSGGVVARVPLCLKEVRLANGHFEGVRAVRQHQLLRQQRGLARPGERPIPTPAIHGERTVAGIRVFVEERLPGVNGAQQTDHLASRARTYLDLADHLSSLHLESRAADDKILDTVVHARARFVVSRLRDPATSRLILRVAENVANRLRGREIPLVIAHADLRAKHTLVDASGRVTGILDWGTLRSPNLPLYDLLHFIVHDRKQQKDESLNAATIRALHQRQFLDIEEAAISLYCTRLHIDDPVRRACELLYPIEVPATTMAHWDYDRPRWVEVNFGDALRAAAAEG